LSCNTFHALRFRASPHASGYRRPRLFVARPQRLYPAHSDFWGFEVLVAIGRSGVGPPLRH
jgi:hypothetical protein